MASSWNNIVKFCSDYIPRIPDYTNSSRNEVTRTSTLTIDQARQKQDAALKTLGLNRYKIPEDGNCMFRAVASQLERDQDENHPLLREAASNWVADHTEELMANGFLDSVEEVQQMRQLGTWQGQAALVALANVLSVNIAIVQGGDKGAIGIQHVKPQDESLHGNIILAYLYNGHYDAASTRDDVPNPQYNRWQEQCRHREEASMRLVKRITDGEAHAHTTYDISEQLARRLAKEESDLHEDSSKQLARRLAEEEADSQLAHRLAEEQADSHEYTSEQLALQIARESMYFQQLHNERSSQPTSSSLCSSRDSETNNNGCARTVTDTLSQHDRTARREVNPARATGHSGPEYSHNKNTPQMVTKRKSPRLAANLPDAKSTSVRSIRALSRDDNANSVNQRNTDRREVVPIQLRTQPPRQARGHRSYSDNIHNTPLPIGTNKGITTTLNRARVCSYITSTPMKTNKKTAYNESDDDLPDDTLSSVRRIRGMGRDTWTLGHGRREVVSSLTQPFRQSTRTCQLKANDSHDTIRPSGSDRDAQPILDRKHRLK